MRYFNKAMLVASAALCLNLSVFSQNITLKTGNVTVQGGDGTVEEVVRVFVCIFI